MNARATFDRLARGEIFREPNALWTREMRQQARVGRTPWILLALTLTISLLLCSIGGIARASESSPATLGVALYQVFFSVAYFVVVLVGPAVAANSIASEREGRTWEAVLLAGLAPRAIARGKFLAAYTTIALYIVVLAPVGALPFLFGGVTATEVVVAFLLLFAIAAVTVVFGLAVSSLMTSLRGAIVVTLILAVCLGPMLFGIFGSGASLGIHEVWRDVPEGFPIWLPLALTRATFGAEYILYLGVAPLVVLGLPTWFLFEVAVANLTGESDDRSTGLKRWFVAATPIAAFLAGIIPRLVDDRARVNASVTGLSILFLHLAFGAFLFSDEPWGPSRRVLVHWERRRAGAFARFFGPGLVRTTTLVLLLGIVAFGATTANDLVAIAFEPPSADRQDHLVAVAAFATYAMLFFVFVAGLTAWLRARGAFAWTVRIVVGAVVVLVSIVPWVVAVLGGLVSGHGADEWVVVGGPSPVFAYVMLSAIRRESHATSAVLVGTACALAWGLVGVLFFARATRLVARSRAAHEEATRRADEALAYEDAARAAAIEAAATHATATATATAGS